MSPSFRFYIIEKYHFELKSRQIYSFCFNTWNILRVHQSYSRFCAEFNKNISSCCLYYNFRAFRFCFVVLMLVLLYYLKTICIFACKGTFVPKSSYLPQIYPVFCIVPIPKITLICAPFIKTNPDSRKTTNIWHEARSVVRTACHNPHRRRQTTNNKSCHDARPGALNRQLNAEPNTPKR